MCGIVGGVGFSPEFIIETQTLEAMCQTIRHRGPDDQGIFVRGRVGLGARRLSIIDLNTGHQPISNEDGTVWVVLNGEIYNYRELRQAIEKRGHHLTTHTDTEVIVHLYEDDGAACVKKLRGMFAFAVWDARRQALLLARDRVGKKPLFYTIQDQVLLFASEIKAILAYPGVARELNRAALDDYFTYGYVPAPATMFQGIHKLPPAHLLRWQDGQIAIEPYWRVDYGVRPATHPSPSQEGRKRETEYIEEIYALLKESVQLRMISDVPLGAFLSGGLDSSVIVGLMSQVATQPVKTFSIGFGEKTYDELEYARIVATHFHTEHHEFQVTPNAQEIIADLVWHLDEPFADSSAIPTYYVAKCAREHVTVALSGDGGDEIFAGYRRYLGRKLAETYNRLPRLLRQQFFQKWIARLPESTAYTGRSLIKKLKRFSEQAADAERYAYSSRLPVLREELKVELYARELREQTEVGTPGYAPFHALQAYFEQCAGQDPITQMMWVDLQTYLPDDILVKVDKMSMAVSLEARAPLLDHKLIEYMAGVPTALKLKGLTLKYLLKQVAARFLPAAIINRPKQGFVVPLAAWFKGELRDYLHDHLLDGTARQRGFFEPRQLERLIAEHQQGKHDYSQELWALLMFELWQRQFLDVSPQIDTDVHRL